MTWKVQAEMTVVLLNPYRPDLIPLQARGVLDGTVLVTEDVPASALWELSHAIPVSGNDDPALVLLSTDAHHPAVRYRIAGGDQVIAAAIRSGEALLNAVSLMDTLRRNGPWEQSQTHTSLRRYLLEEVYELLDAIDADNPAELRDELGDLLLQMLFHARIGADRADMPFDIDDVARAFTAKVAHRSHGVLTGVHADLETQIREWEERKALERDRGSVLDGIATTAPALALAQKVLERLIPTGFPIEVIDPEIRTVSVHNGPDSIEAQVRSRVLALMAQVQEAESWAAADGVALDSPQVWLKYLGGEWVTEVLDTAEPLADAEQLTEVPADEVPALTADFAAPREPNGESTS